MSKQIILTIVLFVVALGSGIVVGVNLKHGGGGDRGAQERSLLADELNLTSAQRDQMREIWSAMTRGSGPGGASRHDSMRQMQKERDDQVVALLTPEQKASYDKIQEHFSQQVADMNHEREVAFQKAVEKTKTILDEKQRAKYEEILKRGPRSGGSWERRGTTRPATAPAAAAMER